MTEKTIEYYIEHPDQLTDEEIERLEGLEASGEATEPEVAEVKAKEAEVPEVEVPIIEAKAEEPAAKEPEGIESRDGKHVIPYWRLADAEAKARDLAAKVAQYEAAAKPLPEVVDLTEITDEDLTQFEGVFPAIGKAVKASHAQVRELQSTVKALLDERAAVQQSKIEEVTRSANEARDANPKLAWLFKNDEAGYDRAANIDAMLRAAPEWAGKPFGDRFEKVVAAYEVLHGEIPAGIKKTETTQPLMPTQPAKPTVPVSMSSIPGGAAPPVDEMAAMSSKTGEELVNQFMGMTKAQVDAVLNRL